MARQTSTFEALSPRFRGFDAYFEEVIAPEAPGLVARGASWPLRALAVAAVLYMIAAAAALWLWPAETLAYQPWAFASFGILLLGLAFGLLGRRFSERRAAISRDGWRAARDRIAAFFGLVHAAAPTRQELAVLVAACPAPAGAEHGFHARERVVGRMRAGPAEGASIDLVEGVFAGRPAAFCRIGYPAAAEAIGALLDDGIAGVPRAGLEALTAPSLPEGSNLKAYAGAPDLGARLTDAAMLATLAEMRRELDATAINLAIVDESARLYLTLAEPLFAGTGSHPTAVSVEHALHDYDALARFAEALAPLFGTPAADSALSRTG